MRSARLVSILAAASPFGCHATDVPPAPTVIIETPAPAPAPLASEAAVVPTVRPRRLPAPTATAGPVGVPECDEYLARFEICVDRPANRTVEEAVRTAMKALREAFQQAAETPQGRAALTAACRQMLDGLAANPMCK